MFYCVSTTYKAGGVVYRKVYPVNSSVKPLDTEYEKEWETEVNRYFDTEDEANKYYTKVSASTT